MDVRDCRPSRSSNDFSEHPIYRTLGYFGNVRRPNCCLPLRSLDRHNRLLRPRGKQRCHEPGGVLPAHGARWGVTRQLPSAQDSLGISTSWLGFAKCTVPMCILAVPEILTPTQSAFAEASADLPPIRRRRSLLPLNRPRRLAGQEIR